MILVSQSKDVLTISYPLDCFMGPVGIGEEGVSDPGTALGYVQTGARDKQVNP